MSDLRHGKPTGASFFDLLHEAFEAACVRSKSSSHDLRLGGARLRLTFAGNDLPALLLPALGHLVVPQNGSPDLEVSLFDGRSAGAAMPAVPWTPDEVGPHGVVERFFGDDVKTMVSQFSGALTIYDAASRRAIWWIADARALPQVERGAPLLGLLHWWTSDHGQQLVHAGAVGRPDRVALIVGKGGSGKSTTAISSLFSDMFYLSDDYCLLSGEEEGPVAYSVFSAGKLDHNGLERLPDMRTRVGAHPDALHDKHLFFLHDHFPDRILRRAPICAILLPRVTAEPTTSAHQVSPTEALLGLAPSTVFQLPGSNASSFRRMAELVRTVPAFRLDLGGSVAEVNAAIARLLDEL